MLKTADKSQGRDTKGRSASLGRSDLLVSSVGSHGGKSFVQGFRQWTRTHLISHCKHDGLERIEIGTQGLSCLLFQSRINACNYTNMLPRLHYWSKSPFFVPHSSRKLTPPTYGEANESCPKLLISATNRYIHMSAEWCTGMLTCAQSSGMGHTVGNEQLQQQGSDSRICRKTTNYVLLQVSNTANHSDCEKNYVSKCQIGMIR